MGAACVFPLSHPDFPPTCCRPRVHLRPALRGGLRPRHRARPPDGAPPPASPRLSAPARAAPGSRQPRGGLPSILFLPPPRAAHAPPPPALNTPHVRPSVRPQAVNMLDWHPSRADLLMTSGTDPAVRLFDLRRAEAPLFELRGHMGPGVSSCKGIYRPVFVAGGDAVRVCCAVAFRRRRAPRARGGQAEGGERRGDAARPRSARAGARRTPARACAPSAGGDVRGEIQQPHRLLHAHREVRCAAAAVAGRGPSRASGPARPRPPLAPPDAAARAAAAHFGRRRRRATSRGHIGFDASTAWSGAEKASAAPGTGRPEPRGAARCCGTLQRLMTRWEDEG